MVAPARTADIQGIGAEIVDMRLEVVVVTVFDVGLASQASPGASA